MPKKIIIIGAGPIGCYTAQLLKIYGFNPLIIEEHEEVGRPIHCTGLVGNKVFEEKRLFKLSKGAILNVINGAVIHYDSQQFIIKRKSVAYVIDREKFDKELSQGLNILYQNKFLGFEKSKSGYIVETDKNDLYADIIIGADGSNSMVRKMLEPETDTQCHKGVQFRIRIAKTPVDLVQVYLKRPSFFWLVPERESIVRIGTISDNPYKDLGNFLHEQKIKGQLLEKFGGVVSSGICNVTAKENIALVGDAACQIKPLTYGGIYFGLKAASILTSCIKENRLCDYDALWKKELGFEIRIGLNAKEIYQRLNKEDLKNIFMLLRRQRGLIEKIGDFENHSRLIMEIIKRPNLYPQLGHLFRLIIKKLI